MTSDEQKALLFPAMVILRAIHHSLHCPNCKYGPHAELAMDNLLELFREDSNDLSEGKSSSE